MMKTDPETKTLFCIRHGHSLGQAANNKVRKTDPELLDAKLSPSGHGQALDLRRLVDEAHITAEQFPDLARFATAELVVVSPLSRALQTACMVFARQPTIPMVCHPAVAEVGGKIPENRARPLAVLRRDRHLCSMDRFASVDFSLIESIEWPPQGRAPPRSDSVRNFTAWLAQVRHCTLS